MDASVVVTGAAWDRSDAAWPCPTELHDDPDVVCSALMRSVVWATRTARRAWLQSGQGDADPARAGCTLGTLYGNDYISEYVSGVLAARGPRWLNPEAFGFAAPHATTAAICIELGIGGSALTLVGPTSGLAAVAGAARALVLGHHDVMLCGAYDWPSALGGQLYRALEAPFTPGHRGAAFLVLEAGGHAAERGARPLGRILGWAARTPVRAGHGDPTALGHTMREAARRAGLGEGVAWNLLDVRDDRLRLVEEEARRAVPTAGGWVAPPERDPSTVVGPVLSLASALASASHPPSGRPTMVSALGATGPYSSLLYQQP
jgi:3-oxoacyl-(acyl-carrier-protein) synthase